jgi:hypothetical protein
LGIRVNQTVKELKNTVGLQPGVASELTRRIHTKIYYAKALLKKIHSGIPGDRYRTRDSKGLRLHTAFTGLKSPLRHFLRYKGQELVAIDIMASQPYLMSRLLERDFWEKKSSKPNLISIHPDLYESLSERNDLSSIIMFTTNSSIISGTGVSGYHYKNIPWQKDYYKLMMDNIEKDFRGDPEVLRCFSERWKTKYHNMLLFFEPSNHRYAYTIPFSRYFPGVFSLMNEIRKSPGLNYSANEDTGENKNNNLPIILQRLEAKVLLETVCKELHQDYPDLLLVTIHDSIITVKEKQDIVQSYMYRIFEQAIGAAPGLKPEPLTPDTVMEKFDEFIEEEWADILDAYKKRKKAGMEFSEEYVQQMMEKLSRLATEPLIQKIPKRGEKQVLSIRFLPDKEE